MTDAFGRMTDLERREEHQHEIAQARADGLKQALEILEDYIGVQGAKIKIVAAIDAIAGGKIMLEDWKASERAAEKACEGLKKIIDAAENSNQAGEDAAVQAWNGPLMYRALVDIAQGNNMPDSMLEFVSQEAFQTEFASRLQQAARDAIAKVQS